MRQYQQLTQDDRIEIHAMKQAGKPQQTIAREKPLDNSWQGQLFNRYEYI